MSGVHRKSDQITCTSCKMSLDGDTVKNGRVCLAIEKAQLDTGLSKYMSRRAAKEKKNINISESSTLLSIDISSWMSFHAVRLFKKVNRKYFIHCLAL